MNTKQVFAFQYSEVDVLNPCIVFGVNNVQSDTIYNSANDSSSFFSVPGTKILINPDGFKLATVSKAIYATRHLKEKSIFSSIQMMRSHVRDIFDNKFVVNIPIVEEENHDGSVSGHNEGSVSGHNEKKREKKRKRKSKK